MSHSVALAGFHGVATGAVCPGSSFVGFVVALTLSVGGAGIVWAQTAPETTGGAVIAPSTGTAAPATTPTTTPSQTPGAVPVSPPAATPGVSPGGTRPATPTAPTTSRPPASTGATSPGGTTATTPQAAVPAPSAQPAQAGAGSLEAIPAALLGEALTVSIAASAGSAGGKPAWEAREVKYTIPGTSVSVRMLGTEAVIVITLTPYRNKDGGLLIVAQGQVWYKQGDAALSYRTTVDTLMVSYGETVLFYPFGNDTEGGSPLRIELVLDKYKGGKTTQTAGTPASASSTGTQTGIPAGTDQSTAAGAPATVPASDATGQSKDKAGP